MLRHVPFMLYIQHDQIRFIAVELINVYFIRGKKFRISGQLGKQHGSKRTVPLLPNQLLAPIMAANNKSQRSAVGDL
jgi:hypothetical protein